MQAYADSLGVDLSFQDFAGELERLPAEYGPPAGVFLLAEHEAVAVGCAGLRRFADGVCEMKRLYVAPAWRGRGAGRLLSEGIVAEARRLGYARIVLDTLEFMKDAQALYTALGFRPIPAYRFNPLPGAAYFELAL